MAFREKIAWAAFITTVLIWGGYFTLVIALSGVPAKSMALLGLFVAATLAQAALIAAAAALWAIRTPEDAHAPADERDRAIGRRATGTAYVAMMLALAGVIVWLHLGLHGRDVIFALIGVFVVAEAARFGAQAIGYRRGFNG